VEAERAGYRPCKRCKPEDLLPPEDPHIRLVKTACETLALAAEGSGEKKRPTLQDLAAEAGLTSSHFHRVFKKVAGITPGKYAREIAGREAREQMDYQRRSPSSIALISASEPSPFTMDTSLSDHQGQIHEDPNILCPEAIDWSEVEMMLGLGMGLELEPWPAGDGVLDTAWLAMGTGEATAADIDPIELTHGVPDMLGMTGGAGGATDANVVPLPTTSQCFGDDNAVPIIDFTEGYPPSASQLFY
jgi:AraC-like DNA-binding protein